VSFECKLKCRSVILKLKQLVTAFFVIAVFFMSSQTVFSAGLTDFKGAPKTIEDFTGKGKWVLVMFWASDCHICNKEAHQYVDFHFTHSDKDAIVLGISTDGKARHQDAVNFIKKHSIDFPNLIGEPEDVTALYSKYSQSRWVGTPSFLLFDPKGDITAAQVGAVPPEVIEAFIEKSTAAAAATTTNQPSAPSKPAAK